MFPKNQLLNILMLFEGYEKKFLKNAIWNMIVILIFCCISKGSYL